MMVEMGRGRRGVDLAVVVVSLTVWVSLTVAAVFIAKYAGVTGVVFDLFLYGIGAGVWWRFMRGYLSIPPTRMEEAAERLQEKLLVGGDLEDLKRQLASLGAKVEELKKALEE